MSRKIEKTSRQMRRDIARTARLEAARREQRRSSRRRKTVMVAASVTALGLVGGGSWAAVGASDSGSSSRDTVALTGLQTYSGLARDHVTGPVAYPQTPPVGGAHSGTWQNCGVYSAPEPSEEAVHSLMNMAPCGSPTVLAFRPLTSLLS